MLVERLKNTMKSRGYSQHYLAKEIGKSITTVNHFLQGKYNADIKGIAALIVDFLDADDARLEARLQNAPFVETAMSRDVGRVIDYARKYSTICAVTGEAGMGKSMILKNYADKHPSTILMEVGAGFTPRSFMCNLLKLIDSNANLKGTTTELTARCIKKLSTAKRLILIDEAELLPYQTLEALRRLYDVTNIGVVLVGMPKLTNNLLGEDGEHAQLHSRVARYFNLPDSLLRDDFDLIVKKMMPEAEDDGIRELLYKFSIGNGRRLLNLVRCIYEESESKKLPINKGLVKVCTDALMSSTRPKSIRR